MDNTKAMLIVLVVIGHTIEPVIEDTPGNLLYRFVYSFHMPAFVFITGYMAQRFRPSVRSYLRIVYTLVIPYLIFQWLHALLEARFADKAFTWDILHPEWTMWFLAATAVWRAVAPLLLKVPYVLPLSVAFSLGTGLWNPLPDVFALNRIVVLLPFFVFGLIVRPRHFDLFKKPVSRQAGFVVLIVLAALSLPLRAQLPAQVFYYNDSFMTMADNLNDGVWWRLVSYATGLAGTLAILSVTPRKHRWWTYAGQYSLYIYLLHTLILVPFRDLGLLEDMNTPIEVVAVSAAAVVVALALGTRPVRWVSRPFVQPPLDRLLPAR
nr:acyltransferase family protein [Microlunatus panaciterrae]